MDDAEQNAGGHPTRGRRPDGVLAATLHERVAAVLRVLEAVGAQAAGVGASRLLETHRRTLAETMRALGDAIAGFFEQSPDPVDMEALRSEFLGPILAISRTLPIFRRVEAWAARRGEAAELHRLVLEGRPVAFDGPSLLLDDFYQRGGAAPALRSRARGLMHALHDELMARGGFEDKQVRTLVIGAHSVLALNLAFAGPELLAMLSVLIVDADSDALRQARQQMEEAFGIRPSVLLAAPLTLASHPARPDDPFDIVYTFAEYDVLPFERGVAFTRSLLPFLRPGGALLTGTLLPQLPRHDCALLAALTGIEWAYWDEASWKCMLGHLPFDLEASRFQVLPPATLVILARRQ